MKTLLTTISVLAILFLVGCTAQTNTVQQVNEEPRQAQIQVQEPVEQPPEEKPPEEPQQEPQEQQEPEPQSNDQKEEEKEQIEPDPSPSTSSTWLTTELTDVNTGKAFTINDFKGKPVLVESFAVWCPKCTKQQKVMKELHKEVGDDVISVALNTDPNENEAIVKSHAQNNGFDWRYVVSPVEVTKSLIAEFGNGVVVAPSVPVILVCEDQSSRLLERGQKSVEDLKSAISEGCGV